MIDASVGVSVFVAVGQSVTVGVDIGGVGGRGCVRVADPAHTRAGHHEPAARKSSRHRLHDACFDAIVHAVAVGVGTGGIRGPVGSERPGTRKLDLVAQAVIVAVGARRIGAERHLRAVAQSVAVGVVVERVGAQHRLFVGAQPVAVGVVERVLRARVARVARAVAV